MGLPEPGCPRSLYGALLEYRGEAVATDLLGPWIDASQASLVEQLAPVRLPFVRQPSRVDWRMREPLVELNWTLYALSRVFDLLLLVHQPASRPDSIVVASEHAGPWDRRIPNTVSDLVDFACRLGARVHEPERFHPMCHEIVELVEDDACEVPVVERLHWPSLLLGELVLLRAGVTLRCARSFASRPWADASTLYWARHRRHRSTCDLSLGWGSNSQWRTSFRRDYAAEGRLVFNAGGDQPLTSPSHEEEPLPEQLRHQLLVNRCFLQSPPPGVDPFPFRWTLEEAT